MTDLYLSDIHGEFPAFRHLLRSYSGLMREWAVRAVPDLGSRDLDAALVAAYYPQDAAEATVDVRRTAADLVQGFLDAIGPLRLHVLGDLWDRGARGDLCARELMGFGDGVDFQWGNHDVCWMGAAAGDPVCVATLLRNNLKYGNRAQFEQGYGIGLDELDRFADRTYAPGEKLSPILKALNAMLFKLEGQACARHPEWNYGDRLLWGRMDVTRGTVEIDGVTYELNTRDFPTYDPWDPFGLSGEEAVVMDHLVEAFRSSPELQAQVSWLYEKGSVYKVDGDLLLFHGCVPMTAEGGFAPVDCGDAMRSGRELLDWTDAICRRAWDERDTASLDWMGFLWGGWQSTFAGRVVKTFERTYIDDESTWKEPEDHFYKLTNGDDPACARTILAAFGIDPERGRLVNGHTPVKLPKGQSPVRAAGRRLVIDGGLCKAYRKSTGIAGYTLVRDGQGELRLITHGEYPGDEAVFGDKTDMDHESAAIA